MSLTAFLQDAFLSAAPEGWQSSPEVALFPPALSGALGFSPRADVLLEHEERDVRIWIEFEVSRADPGANHLKFAVGHVFSPQPPGDTFVSMVSNHVARGRANLGAGAILLMRHLGMSAFQVPLLPQIEGKRIKALNHLPADMLRRQRIDTRLELARALAIVTPVLSDEGGRIFYASNEFEVALNVRRWNEEVRLPANAALWGKRTITYFVFDPDSGLFAPSKFCAFMPIDATGRGADRAAGSAVPCMTVQWYCSLDQGTPRFDGGIAQRHLQRQLNYVARPLAELPQRDRFSAWLSRHADLVRVRAAAPVILVPGRP
jgi:hypothetical protein